MNLPKYPLISVAERLRRMVGTQKVPGSNPVVGTAFHVLPPANSAVHPLGSVNGVPRIFFLEYHSGGIQAAGPHQLYSCPYTNLRQQINITCLLAAGKSIAHA